MSPDTKRPEQQATPLNNLYTVILLVACAVVLATCAYAAYKGYVQYKSFLPLP